MKGRKIILYTVLFGILAGMFVIVFQGVGMKFNRSDNSGHAGDSGKYFASNYTDRSVVYLYFESGEGPFLTSEERVLPRSDDPAESGRIIMEALIEGSRDDLERTIPPETTVNAFYVTPEGTAYVDISEGISEKHPGGCSAELSTIFSIVNSLALNIPEIDTVKILINGRESATLAGHVDIRCPFKANMLMIR